MNIICVVIDLKTRAITRGKPEDRGGIISNDNRQKNLQPDYVANGSNYDNIGNFNRIKIEKWKGCR